MDRPVRNRYLTLAATALSVLGAGLLLRRWWQPDAQRTAQFSGLRLQGSTPSWSEGTAQRPTEGRYLASVAAALALVCAGLALGWMRQPLELRHAPPLTADLEQFRLMQNGIGGTPPESYFVRGQPYEASAYDLSQGKRLYVWFGCPACHGDGRGGTGPSFIDGWWNYGPEMVTIVTSIRDGRPHGMPAFRDQMTIDQIWQLAGYIRTLGSYQPKTTAPGRNDDRQTRPAENRGPAIEMFDEGPVPTQPMREPAP